jgi:hypothetical protein
VVQPGALGQGAVEEAGELVREFARLTEVSAVPLGMPHEPVAARRGVALGGVAARFSRPVTPMS